jgi:peptidoglycan hydrolase-like protein with peptidoglycan-binding domain
MTLANSVFTKASVAFVALATAFVLAAPAQAQLSETEMQSEIDRLTALIEQLTSSLGGGSGDSMMSSSSVCPYTWTRNLTSGDTGMDVMKLQQFLNSNELTRVAAAGSVGSAGMETEYYGPATGAAVAKFQEANRAAILSPLGLVNSTPFFGPSTRAEANAQCTSAPVVVDDSSDDDDSSSDDDDDTSGKTLGNDEGSLDNIDKVSADENNLEEGKTQGVFAFTVEVEGDVEIDRVDVYMDNTAAGAQSDNADDYFEGAELWVDGDKVADLDVSDFREETSYASNFDALTGDSKAYRLRFAGLGLVFEDGDEPEFQIALAGVNNIDSTDLTEDWALDNPSFRYVDGQGFTDTVNDASVSEVFSFDAEETAELDISKSSDSPDATTVEVDDNDTSSEITLFIFEIEEQNGVDATVNDLTLTASTTAGDVTSTIDEVILYVDGDEVGSESPNASGVLNFENLDIDIDGEDTVEITAKVVFNGTDDYTEGDSAYLAFTSIDDAEDANGNDEGDMTISGTPTGDSFTLRSEGISVVKGSHDFDTQGTDDTIGVFTIEFDVTAFGDDFYIAKNATSTDDDTDGGVNYTVTGSVTSQSGALSSTADEDTVDVFTVNRGDTETFTLTVTVDAAAAGLFSVSLDDIWFTATSDGVTGLETDPATPTTDFRVVDKSINQ